MMRSKTFYFMLILTVLLLATVFLFLNRDETINNTNNNNEIDNTYINPDDNIKNMIKPRPAKEKNMSHYTLLEKYKVDFDNDKVEENVELYAQVEVTEDGEYMWDDGQRWLLLVRNGNKVYIIFDDYVQLGRIDVKLYHSYEDDSVHLTMILMAGAGYIIKDYIYNNTDDYFQEELILERNNINWIQKVYN